MSDTLPVSVLLGTDTPELAELLVGERSKGSEEAFAVTTRAATCKKQQDESSVWMEKGEGV